MRALIACEYSGVVRDALIARGVDAVSCDQLPSERPGPHLQGEQRLSFSGLSGDNCGLRTSMHSPALGFHLDHGSYARINIQVRNNIRRLRGPDSSLGTFLRGISTKPRDIISNQTQDHQTQRQRSQSIVGVQLPSGNIKLSLFVIALFFLVGLFACFVLCFFAFQFGEAAMQEQGFAFHRNVFLAVVFVLIGQAVMFATLDLCGFRAS